MTFFIFALSQNGARRNDVFNGFPFSSLFIYIFKMCVYNKTTLNEIFQNSGASPIFKQA
jgi:hypothetical protein